MRWIVAIAVIALIAIPIIRGPKVTEYSTLICEFPTELAGTEIASDTVDEVECQIRKDVDSWYYYVGEFGFFVGDFETSQSLALTEMAQQVREPGTSFQADLFAACIAFFRQAISEDDRQVIMIDAERPEKFALACKEDASA